MLASITFLFFLFLPDGLFDREWTPVVKTNWKILWHILPKNKLYVIMKCYIIQIS